MIFIFWFVHIVRRTLFFSYLFQLKEYRLDRFLEEASRNRKIIFSKYFFLGIISLFFRQWIVFLYLFLFAYSLFLLIRKKWQLPVFTKKMIVWLGLTLFLEISLFFTFSFAFFAPILEIFFPVFIYFCLLIVQIFVFFEKKRIINKAKKRNLDMKVIGITGSYGKTSMKEILYCLLEKKYKVVKTKEHVNTEMGVAKTVLGIKEADVFICEMGAYKKGEIKDICDIAKPEIGILTGINEQHLALFGSQENIIKGKYELIESLPENGLAVFNGENRHCLELYKKTNKNKIIYNYPEKIEVSTTGSRFSLDGFEFKTKLLGKHNVLNIVGAVRVAQKLGIDLQTCAKVVGELEQELGGMTLKGRIIDSSYSSNPTGVMFALEYLSLFKGKKAIVLPGIIELGKASKAVHRKIEDKILEVCDVAITTTKGIFDKIEYVADIDKIAKRLEKADAILIEGRVSKNLINKL